MNTNRTDAIIYSLSDYFLHVGNNGLQATEASDGTVITAASPGKNSAKMERK